LFLKNANTRELNSILLLLGAAALGLTKQTAKTHVSERAHEAHLLGTAWTAFGLVAREHLLDKRFAFHWENTHASLAWHIRWALDANICTLLAREFRANRGGNAEEVLHVLGGALCSSRALVELGLWVIDGLSTSRLGVVFTRRRVVNNAFVILTEKIN